MCAKHWGLHEIKHLMSMKEGRMSVARAKIVKPDLDIFYYVFIDMEESK